MAVLTEMVQTGLYILELFCAVYAHLVSMAKTLRDQLTAVDIFNSMAENAVLQALETHSDYTDTPNDIGADSSTEQKDDERLRKAHDEVEILQKQKNKAEQDLYKMQEAKERVKASLKKADIDLAMYKSRSAKADGQVTH